MTIEGSHYRHYIEFVDNYFALQGSIESTLKVPNQPIDVGVAQDASRSTRSTKVVQGKIICTSTVAFKVLVDSPSNPVTNFEEDLKRWIKTEWDVKKHTSDELTDDEIRLNLCEEFLRQLGGVTHFVSSVTLGAVEHTQMKVLAREMKTSESTSVGAERVGSSKVKASTHKFNKTVNDKSEKIGRFGEKEKDTVKEKAVVRYAFTSVASLITTDIKLMEVVQKAVVNYTNQKLSRESKQLYSPSALVFPLHSDFCRLLNSVPIQVLKLVEMYGGVGEGGGAVSKFNGQRGSHRPIVLNFLTEKLACRILRRLYPLTNCKKKLVVYLYAHYLAVKYVAPKYYTM